MSGRHRTGVIQGCAAWGQGNWPVSRAIADIDARKARYADRSDSPLTMHSSHKQPGSSQAGLSQADSSAQPLAPSMDLLERNLRLLQMRSPLTAKAIAQTLPRTDMTLTRAADGLVTGTIIEEGSPRQLASLRGPALEAKRLADSVDLKQSALVAVRGFGLGHHVQELSTRLGRNGVVICFEPDVAMLRALLERVDFAAMFSRFNVVIVTTADDTGAMSDALHGLEGLIAAGVAIVDHPASKSRLGEASETFAKTLLTVIQAARTNVVTTLVQVEQTMMNYMGNVHTYAACPGIADLENAAKGRTAVVVAAGPSLRKNIEQLRSPPVRERVVVIAVQTVLKQLLAMGIKPDYVCALDYHEISTRFYEGLTAADVEGVTLVVEPKASPAIIRAFPGKIRCVGDDVLDRMIGSQLAKPMGELPPGATVAHLCYYLARHLGCDPVVLIGQDLGFTDHQYYSPGAAIHQVWASELGPFRTLETLEFERIMRMRGWLRKLKDVSDKPIFTDEQMHTYLMQFERDFMRDVERGLTTIDATEGGVRKQHTTPMTLADALAAHATGDAIRVPVAANRIASTREAMEQRLTKLHNECSTLMDLCDSTMSDLTQMKGLIGNTAKVNAIIERIQPRGVTVQKMDSHWLVQRLSQNGQLKRFKADRDIALSTHSSVWDEQRLRIERDFINMEILRAGATRMQELLSDAIASGRDESATSRTGIRVSSLDELPPIRKVAACIWVDVDRGNLLTPRDLSQRIDGKNVLSRTLSRLEACEHIESIVLMSPHAGRVAELLRDHVLLKPTEIVELPVSRMHERLTGVKASRIFQRSSWRGGINALTVFDELFEPQLLAKVMQEREIDAAVLVGADWCVIDANLVDQTIARYRSDPVQNRLTFSQAAVGLCGCVIDRSIAEDLARAKGPWATIGAVLGYHPHAPKGDPIAKDPCVKVSPAVRDVMLRCVWDDINFQRVWSRMGEDAWTLQGDALASALRVQHDACVAENSFVAEILDINLERLTADDMPVIVRELRRLMQSQPALAVTIRDQAGSGAWQIVVDAARSLHVAGIHIRFSQVVLSDDATVLLDALDMHIDAISLDLPGDSQRSWEVAQAMPSREATWEAVQAFLDERAKRIVSLPHTWLVPRMAKHETTLDDLDSFFDRWLLTAGACVIDPPQRAGRIEPLPLPRDAACRDAWAIHHLQLQHTTIAASGAAQRSLPAFTTAGLERAI